MSRSKNTRTCVDCGGPVKRWDAVRCLDCYERERAVTPLYEPNTSGLCRCGCGERTPIATRNDRKYGIVKGQPIQFLTGHHRRLSPVRYIEEDRGYETPCWIWQMGMDGKGYGQFAVPGGKGRSIPAHVHMYTQKYGVVSEGKELDHLCRVRACCNPDHVEAVPRAINLRRGANTKLTQEAVDEIRRLYAIHGQPVMHTLAEQYGVTYTCIDYVVKYKSWR